MNYDRKYADVSMPGYIAEALHKFQHPTPKQYQHALHAETSPSYVSRVQCSHTKPDLPTLEPSGTQRVQSIAVTFYII